MFSLREDENLMLKATPEIKSGALETLFISAIVEIIGFVVIISYNSITSSLPLRDSIVLATVFALIVVPLIFAGTTLGTVIGYTYYITDERIVAEFNFIMRSSSMVKYDRITDIHPRQRIFDRLFNTGTIGVHTAGSNRTVAQLKWIKEHQKAESIISERIESAGDKNSY